MKIEIESEEGTRHLAEEIAGLCRAGIVIGLMGELGAGKTTFTRYFCQALKVGEPVSSPTYVLEHEYRTPDGILIDHWDLYRLGESPEELYLPVENDCIRIIEWISKDPCLLEQADLIVEVKFSNKPNEEQARICNLQGPLLRMLASLSETFS